MPKAKVFHSIKTRFLLTLTPLFYFFALILIASIAGWAYRSKLIENQANMIHHAESAVASLDLLFEQPEKIVNTIAGFGDVKEFVARSYSFDQTQTIEDEAYLELQNHINGELEDFNLGNQYKSIYLMDRSGNVLVSTDKSFEKKNFSFRDYFKKAMLGQPGLDAVVGSITNELGFFFSQAIYGEDDDIIGVAVLKYGHERVFELLESAKYFHFSGDKVFLISRQQQIIYPPSEDLVFLKMPNTTVLEKLKFTSDQITLSSPLYQNFAAHIENYQGGVFFKIPSDKQLNFVIKQNETQDFFMILEQEVSKVTRQPRDLAIITAAIVLLMSAFLALGVYLLINGLIEPLKKLKVAAGKISQNDWNYSLDFSSNRKDEFSDLANSFSEMAGQIKQSQENLTQEVEKKTASLQEKVTELEKLTNSMANRELKMLELKKQVSELQNREKSNEDS